MNAGRRVKTSLANDYSYRNSKAVGIAVSEPINFVCHNSASRGFQKQSFRPARRAVTFIHSNGEPLLRLVPKLLASDANFSQPPRNGFAAVYSTLPATRKLAGFHWPD